MPLKPHEGETKNEYTSRCIKTEIDNGKPQEQAVAICIIKADEHFSATSSVSDATWSTEAPINVNLESYSDYPESVKSNAKNVLDWVNKNGWGSCGTSVGKTRANQLANGEPISTETIQRMYSYLSRHEADLQSSKSYSDGCGKLMYDSWGGLSAKSWSHNKLKELGLIELSIDLSKVSFDYDETLSTPKGMEMAKRAIDRGDTVYIISARRDRTGMLTRAKELGIPPSRVYATGSNKAKAEKVKELGITRHIDNNGDVVKSLPGIGEKFGKIKRVIFNEDFDEDVVREYKEKGFKVQIRSSRKIQRKDRKVWNKLRSVGLTEDNLVFGDLRELNKKYDYDLMFTGEDPMLEKLLTLGSVEGKYIGEPVEINSMEEAIKAQDLVKTVELKFVTVSVVYVYQERPNVAPAESGSRPFCTKLLGTPNREYTLDEIQNLPTSHLKKMGLPEDPFLYRGGFYTTPGGVRGINTTPFCRHQWVAKVKIV